MSKLFVDASVQKKIANGVQLLDKHDIANHSLANQLVFLYSSSAFLGTAYLSEQHKGMGWFLSPKAIKLDVAYFVELFEAARKKRHSYENDTQTTAYRLFNQDGDNFGGLTIDRYGDYALFSWYNVFVYENRQVIIKAFQLVFPDLVGAYEKIRFRGLDYESAHLYGQEAPETFTILENGVAYSVFLNEGLMTGIFLDQHEVRANLIDGLAMGKRLLNMFSYTAAFSVAAAMGGAYETTSVDLARRSRDLSKAHFLANGLTLENHRFVVMDAFDYFKYAQRKGLCFDVIILDPPSFAHNKKQTFSVAKDYHKLVFQALGVLAPKGLLIASTNAANVSQVQFKKQLEKGFGDIRHTYLDFKTLPADFVSNKADRKSQYLKVFTVEVEQ
ncbi:class I SAM-dependent rRNA methyltransferase [Streptococcus sciuri]|uniref:Class I SAM-dependent rRNA methyltransferase n=1 Tax=Streptococcus sciuri TaxID=2973939 RepID=A0ABT2F6D2_9STRE|nr:class I SAM-dependent rRNA methyltransferase [Streptococcus sciuri]MCS4488033.1 class I SAM-dependent rRNA methyltransferase [Streptococcus sciuri]